MKRAFQALIFTAAALFLSSCGSYNGGSSSTTTTTPVASAAKRAFVVNQFGSVVDVVDSQHDIGVFKAMQVNGNANEILVMSNKKSIVHSTTGSVVLLDNASETTLGTVNSFPGASDSVVVSPDGLFAYAAIPSLGKVSEMDLTKLTVTNIPADTAAQPVLPGVRRIAITHDGKTILTFSDNNDTVSFIDRTNADAVSAPLAGFDRPYTAVFSSDDATAYVLNCGKECGGTAAGVAIVNMATHAITRTVPVRAATVGLLDGANLYVAGTDVTVNQGRVDVLNTSTFAVAQAATPISDGLHTKMGLGTNSKLYIGAKACSNAGGQCLSVYNTGSGTAAVLAGNSTYPALGDVTAITPIVGRTVVYIIQNGQLVIYDTTTDAPQATQIFISGKVTDVKEVDN